MGKRAREEGTEEDHAEEDSADQGDHEHGGVNPHVWLDPTLMSELVPLLVSRLAEVDPENASSYEANGERLVAELGTLNAELQEVMEPIQGAAFVPFHEAWPYFARHFGLDLVVEYRARSRT